MSEIERELRMSAREEAHELSGSELPARVRAAIPAAARRARLEAARRAVRRAQRRQMLLFALAVGLAVLMGAAALIAWRAGAQVDWLWAVPAAGAALMLLMGPVLGYFGEEEQEDV